MNIPNVSSWIRTPSKSNSTTRPAAADTRSSISGSVEQSRQRGARVVCAHEGFTDEEGVYAGRAQPRHVFARGDAAFSHQQVIVRDIGPQQQRRFDTGFKGTQIAAVDAD